MFIDIRKIGIMSWSTYGAFADSCPAPCEVWQAQMHSCQNTADLGGSLAPLFWKPLNLAFPITELSRDPPRNRETLTQVQRGPAVDVGETASFALRSKTSGRFLLQAILLMYLIECVCDCLAA